MTLEARERRILVLASSARDSSLTVEVLSAAYFESETRRDMVDLMAAIADGAGAVVVVAEEALQGPGLGPLLELLARQPAWSDLPFVVLGNSPAPGREPLRLPALGNVTILERPVMKSTLVSAVRAALGARLRQYQVRTLVSELESRVKERDQFLAMLGHELRNPLAAILTTIELMNRRNDPAFGRERAVIERQTLNLRRLVDDLLDVSRVTSGKIKLDRQPVDLQELLKRCVDPLRETARLQRVELVFEGPQAPVAVLGDAVRLEQVVINLLTNALKFTPAGGRVKISLERLGDAAVVRMADSGIGIEASVLPRVFEMFVQGPEALDRRRGGLGIGLTLVKTLVELHGGKVSATSAGRGRGSEFSFQLPVTDRAPASLPGPAATATTVRRRVVIVEDNGIVRESLQAVLDASGHEVETADDGAEGLECILANRPDFAIVDIGLPLMDGYELARRVRAELGEAIVLVALSGYGQPEDRERSLAAGFDAHLTKPIQLAALEQLIAGVVMPSKL